MKLARMLTGANTTALMDFLCGGDFFALLMTGFGKSLNHHHDAQKLDASQWHACGVAANTMPQAVANWPKLQ